MEGEERDSDLHGRSAYECIIITSEADDPTTFPGNRIQAYLLYVTRKEKGEEDDHENTFDALANAWYQDWMW